MLGNVRPFPNLSCEHCFCKKAGSIKRDVNIPIFYLYIYIYMYIYIQMFPSIFYERGGGGVRA